MKSFFDKENKWATYLTEYKDDLDFKSRSFDEVRTVIDGAPIIVSIKIDGILSLLYFNEGISYLITKEGRVTEDLPILEEINKILNGKKETILIGEFYGVDEKGKELPFNETLSITRKPEDKEAERRLRLGIFDIHKYDGKDTKKNKYSDRMLLIQELFEDYTYAKPVYAKNDDGSSVIEDMWNSHVLQEGHEGLVLQTNGETIKIKPKKSVDALVVAIKPNKYGTSMGSLFLALLDTEGAFRSLSFVGTGFSDEDRKLWWDYANNNRADAPNRDGLLWVNIEKDPKIIEVDYEQSLVKDLEAFNFKDNKWVMNENEKLSSTLRKPVFVRIRDDKKVNDKDLRLTQIPELDEAIMKKKSFKISAFTYSFYTKLPFEYLYFFDNSEKIGTAIYTIESQHIKLRLIETTPTRRREGIATKMIDIIKEKYPNKKIIWIGTTEEGAKLKEFIEQKKSFKINGFYPKHPDTVIVKKNQYYSKPLLEKDIWSFYDKVKHKIIEQTKGKNVLLYLRVDGDIIKRKNDGILRIDNVNDFNRLNSGRMIEAHSEIAYERGTSYYTDIIFCDIDPQDNYKFENTKELVKEVYKIFKKDQHVKNVKINYSGGRGFHVIGQLKHSWEVDQARSYTKKLLKQLETDKVKLTIVREKNMVRLDTSLLKQRGSLRVAYSLNKETGLVCLPIGINDLDKFKKEDATTYQVLKKFNYKKSFKLTSEVISGLWGIWNDEVEAETGIGLYHETWFSTIGFPNKNTEIGRSLFDKVTRGRFIITNRTLQIRIYKGAGDPQEAIDKSNRLMNRIGHKDAYDKVEFYVEDDRTVERIAINKISSILDYSKTGLEPKIWNYETGNIHPEVKQQIIDKINTFIEKQDYLPNEVISKIYILGSLTSYQYNKYTDLDTHIFINLDQILTKFTGNREELIELIDNNWRKLLREETENVQGTQHPIEFYFEIPEDIVVNPSDGIYDLLNDKWLKEPKVISSDFDVEKLYPEVINNAKALAKELDLQFGEVKRNVIDVELLQEMVDSLSDKDKIIFKEKLDKKIEETEEIIASIINKEQEVSDRRHEDYAWDSPGNITFKYVQRYGYVALAKLLEKAIGPDKVFNVDDIESVQKVLNPIKSFKIKSLKWDKNSTKNEGRFRLIDPNKFEQDSFRRWAEWAGVKAPKGLTFLVGDLKDNKGKALQTLRFNKDIWDEKKASQFWNKVKNKKGFEKTWEW